jgi:hypothetical protein
MIKGKRGGCEMLRTFYVIIVLIFLTSCSGSDELLHVQDVSTHSSNLTFKSGIPLLLTKPEQLQTIGVNMYSFVSVNEWFDKETILYLSDESGISYIYKFNILTGEEEVFFQINEPILQLEANPENSIFTIEVATMNGQKELYFVNKTGEVLHKLEGIEDEFHLYWNPYKENELVIAVLQQDYSMKMLNLNLRSKSLTNFDFEYYYLQWIAEEEMAYLKWDSFSLSYYAPLFSYNKNGDREIKIADDVIAFFGYRDTFLTISIDNSEVQKSNYLFYHSETKEELENLQVPILNTYSGQWWIPNHDFHTPSKTFYLINPNTSGDVFDYSNGYKVVSFQIETGKKKEIISIDTNYPIKLSPDGRWLLYGYQLENIIDITNRETHSLLYW